MTQLEFKFVDEVEKFPHLHPCTNLGTFLRAEIKIMKKHIEKHKYYQHITDNEHAIEDFNNKYGWLMREMYCNYSCPERDGCIYFKYDGKKA